MNGNSSRLRDRRAGVRQYTNGGPVDATTDVQAATIGTVADLYAAPIARRAGLFASRWLMVAATTAAVGVPAAVLRLWHINVLGFNSDEAVYAGQAASLAGDPRLSHLFPVFRAHPLLFQMLVSLAYRVQVSDLAPRLIAVAFGLGTVVAGYAAASRIFGRRAAVMTALLLAVMPYLVVVNRQGLLDGPMVFFSVVALWLLARFAARERRADLYAAGAALGLAFLSKETAVLLVPAAYAFLALTPSVRVRVKDMLISFAVFAAVALVYPVSSALAGGKTTGSHFFVWQLFRPANHPWTFYFRVVPLAIGIPVVVLAIAALVATAIGRRWSWRETLLVCWIMVPFLFLQIWPVKGYQYLLPAAAPAAVLAAGLLSDAAMKARFGLGRIRGGSLIATAVVVVTVVWLAATSWTSISAASSTSFLAGTGGVPGGRQAGEWISSNIPSGAEALSIGPSMANILQFYGQREVLGLSVSPNPLHRNPAYAPVINPDLLLRSGQVQYLVWDAYSAARSTNFSQRLLTYVRRYHGIVVHVESVNVATAAGTVARPVIVIYEVHP